MWAISDFGPVHSIGDPGDGTVQVATVPTCGPFVILSPIQSIADSRDGRGKVATMPTYGPFRILSPVQRNGDPRDNHRAHMSTISHHIPVQSIGDPRHGRGC